MVAGGVRGDIVVLTNRTAQPLEVVVSPENERPYTVRLASGEVTPLRGDSPLQIAYQDGGRRQPYTLAPNRVYFFGRFESGVRLQGVGLGGDASTAAGRPLPPVDGAGDVGNLVVTVRLFVDDDEPTRQVLWEQKLRARVAEASGVLAKHAGVELRVVGVGRWVSDNKTNDFKETLREFEKNVDPGAARLVIGFTSQYEAPRGRIHLGGTRGPLARHVMIREWSAHVSERERLELLLHELGHFLGATHSPQRDSVMRPVLGDRQSRRKGFDVRFDPVNTLIMGMVTEEMRRRGIDRFGDLSDGTRRRLAQVYGVMAKAIPDDASSKAFQTRVRGRRLASPSASTRRVLEAVVASAASRGDDPPAAGDRLTERYVRAAAAEAARLPPGEGPRALLLTLGIAIDDSAALAKLPITRGLVADAEPAPLRARRLQALGKPTLEGRRDLAKHFFVAAHLTAAQSGEAADRLGMTKEALDANGGSGFSFADVAANRAGIRFAESVLSGRLTPEGLSNSFRAVLFMPPVEGLPEGLTREQLVAEYGGPGDKRFEAQLAKIDARINALLPYAPVDAGQLDLPRRKQQPAP